MLRQSAFCREKPHKSKVSAVFGMVIASFMIFNQLKAAGSGMAILRLTESAIDRANDLDEGAQTIVPAVHEIKFDKLISPMVSALF